MTGEKKHIDKLFRDGLNGLHEKPPAYTWNRLEQSLDHSRDRKKRLYYWLAAASVLIVMAFGAGYFYAIHLKQPVKFAEKEIQQENVPLNDTADTIQNQYNKPAKQGDETDLKVNSRDDQVAFSGEEQQGKSDGTISPTIVSAEVSRVNPAVSSNLGERSESAALSSLAFVDVKEITIPEPAGFVPAGSSENKPVYPFANLEYYPEDYGIRHNQPKNRWSLGAQFAPTYSFRELSADYGVNVIANQQAVDELNNVEEGLLSYAGGVDVGYHFSGKWSMQSGVYFSRIGQVNSDALQFKAGKNELVLYAINTSTGNINVAFDRVPENLRKIQTPKDTSDMSGFSNVKIIQNFDLFEIPFLVRYKFLDRKFSMNLSGGLSPAYLVDNNIYLESEQGKYDVGNAGNLNTMFVNTSLGLGFEYLITKKLSVNFEPTFKYSLSPINNNNAISYHPYYFSWFTGIRLRIK